MVSPPDARERVSLVEPREAAANAAVELIQPGMTIGLGSGRAVWAVTTAAATTVPVTVMAPKAAPASVAPAEVRTNRPSE